MFISTGLVGGNQLGCLRADLQIYIRESRACFISLTTLTTSSQNPSYDKADKVQGSIDQVRHLAL